MTDTRQKLKQLGRRRASATAKLEQVRQELAALLPEARQQLTWREIADLTTYTETQLQTMLLTAQQKEEREERRRARRRTPQRPEEGS